MKKKIISSLLAVSVLMTALTGCGGGDKPSNDAQGTTASTGNEAAAPSSSGNENAGEAAPAADEGKVINIYSFNDELRKRITAVYPEIESTSKDGTSSTLKDGTEIHWIINPNQDGVYQDKLDEALGNQMSAADDDKVDIFAAELDYIVKYTDADGCR